MRHYWVDRIEVTKPGVEGVGRKAVAFSEDFFTDHFPGNPVLPGVYIVEGMAQTAGAIISASSDWKQFALMVSVDRARFSSFVRPGDVVEYAVVVTERSEAFLTVGAKATVAGRNVAQARITFRLLELSAMIAEPYLEQWNHSMSLLFDPAGARPEEVDDP